MNQKLINALPQLPVCIKNTCPLHANHLITFWSCGGFISGF